MGMSFGEFLSGLWRYLNPMHRNQRLSRSSSVRQQRSSVYTSTPVRPSESYRKPEMSKMIHSSEVDPSKWRWPNFSVKEIACKGDGMIIIHEESLDKLQKFRELTGVSVILNSAFRSPEYNKKAGGAPKSMQSIEPILRSCCDRLDVVLRSFGDHVGVVSGSCRNGLEMMLG